MKRFLFLALLVAGISASAAQIRVDNPSCQGFVPPNNAVVTDVFNLNNGFSFSVTQQTGGQPVFYFCNDTGQDWTSLLLAIHTSLDVTDVGCSTSGAGAPNSAPAFQYCTLTSPGNGLLYADFTNTPPIPTFSKNNSDDSSDDGNKGSKGDDGGDDDHKYPGVKNGDIFIVDLTCLDPKSPACNVPNWNPGDGGNGYANYDLSNGYPVPPTPEPATLALIATGIGALVLGRKRAR